MRVEYILPFVIGLLVFVLVMMVGINVTSHRGMLQDQRKEDQARIEEIQRRIDSKLDMLLTPEGLEQIVARLEYNRDHDNACYPPPGFDTAPLTIP